MKNMISALAVFIALGTSSAVAADIAPASMGWAGPYIGINGGFGSETWKNWTQYDGFTNPRDRATSSAKSVSGSSAFGGAQIGYNFQHNNLVFGIEGDFQFSAMQSNDQGGWTFDSCGCFNVSMNNFGTLRGKLGFAPSDAVLFYVTGGGILGSLNYVYSDHGPPGSTTNSALG